MKKANLQTWKTTRKVQKCKTAEKLVTLTDDRKLFARFLVVARSRLELNLKDCIGEFEFAVSPRSIFTMSGSLRPCTNKSKLMTILEILVPERHIKDIQPRTGVTILDGMAVVQAMGKPAWVRTGKDLANHFLDIVDSKSLGFDEVQIIFDRYDIVNSLKERTRQLRMGDNRAICYDISDDAVIEKITLKQLLSTNINKQRLSLYLAAHILKHHKASERVYVTTQNQEVNSNKIAVCHLKRKQEEADTRMLLHAIDATKRGVQSICIQSPDTDVLVLALWCFHDLCPDTSLLVGTGSKRRHIKLHPIHDALRPQQVSALVGFHAFSGCDQTGAFCGKYKLSCWKALEKANDKVLQAFGNLGTQTELEESDYCAIEQYTCQLYLPGTSICSVKEMRWYLFSKRQLTDVKLPPTRSALEQMINRANYVTMVWKQCAIASPNLPLPVFHGWRQDGEHLIPVPTTSCQHHNPL